MCSHTFSCLPHGTDTTSCKEKHKATSQRMETGSAAMLTTFQGSFTLHISPSISHTFTRFAPAAWKANQTAHNTNTDPAYTEPNSLFTKRFFLNIFHSETREIQRTKQCDRRGQCHLLRSEARTSLSRSTTWQLYILPVDSNAATTTDLLFIIKCVIL